jgi:membrane protein YdbS with pleckstrin-like domain
MAEQSQSKTIDLQPSWKNHILGYGISVLLIPLFGIGLIGLYWVYKQQKKYSYTFSDTQISSRDDKYQRNIDLVNIENVELEQNWLQKKMRVGDLVLYTSATSMTLRGMENPLTFKDMLEKAISAEKQRLQEKEKTRPRQPEHDPGTMERMDYLTGLWQQGLVSEEDFEKERKHFE